MSEITLRIGTGARVLVTKDPSDIKTYVIDWDSENLSGGTTISSSTWTLTQLAGVTTTPLTSDQDAIISGSRRTRIRLTAGALGSHWRVDNRIVTTETPPQTKDRAFYVLIEDR